MRSGEVWLVSYHTVSGGPDKIRPVLVLAGLPGTWQNTLICGLSTQIERAIPEWDDVIRKSSTDFKSSGLLRESVVSLSYLISIDSSEVNGRKLGRIDAGRLRQLCERLADLLAR